MNQEDQELINRYLYEVGKRVPKARREEIMIELEDQIYDMYEAENGTISEILLQIGSPKDVADRYLDYSKHLKDPEYNSKWNPVKIPPVNIPPVRIKKVVVRKGESYVSLIFIAILAILLICIPKCFGAYVINDGKLVHAMPIFNMKKWNILLPCFLLYLGICFLNDSIKLINRHNRTYTMFPCIVLDIVQLGLATIIFKLLPVWNPDFAKDLTTYFNIKIKSKADILYYWGTDTFSNFVLLIIYVITLLEMFSYIYRTLHYSRQENQS